MPTTWGISSKYLLVLPWLVIIVKGKFQHDSTRIRQLRTQTLERRKSGSPQQANNSNKAKQFATEEENTDLAN